jgi:hypothetical protein
MFAGFLEADKAARRRLKTSGTTATLAVVVGWELFVANVGDSDAYLDTGKQVRVRVCVRVYVCMRVCVCVCVCVCVHEHMCKCAGHAHMALRGARSAQVVCV